MERGARPRMPMLARAVAAGVVVVSGAMSVVACAPSSPQPTPTPTAIFASEEEALAAATDTYAKYSAAFDQTSSEGEASSEALAPYVTQEYLDEFDEAGLIQVNGWHTRGSTSFDSVALLDVQENQRMATVSVRLCRDVSGVQILDTSGAEVTPASRMDRFPLEVRFRSDEVGSARLLISESGSWAGDNFC